MSEAKNLMGEQIATYSPDSSVAAQPQNYMIHA